MRVLLSSLLSTLLFLSVCRATPAPPAPRELKLEPVAGQPARGVENAPTPPLSLFQEGAPAPQESISQEQVPTFPRGADGPPWVLIFTPYVWLLSVDGDGRIGGNDVDIDESFSDIFDQLNWVAQGRLEAYRGKWGFTIDLTYADLENDVDVGPFSGEVDVDMGLYSVGAHYEVYRGPLGEDSDTIVKAEVGAGFVRTILDSELTFDTGPLPDVRVDEEWLDVVASSRATFRFDEKNKLRTEVFLGGFELLGDSSDLIWGIDAFYGREVGKRGNKVFWIGWRYWAIDYDPGNSFAMDITMSGPAVGFSWRY